MGSGDSRLSSGEVKQVFDEIRGRIATHRYLVAPHEVQCLKKCQDDTRQRPVVVGLAAGAGTLLASSLPVPSLLQRSPVGQLPKLPLRWRAVFSGGISVAAAHFTAVHQGEACICSLLALQKSPLAQETALLTTQVAPHATAYRVEQEALLAEAGPQHRELSFSFLAAQERQTTASGEGHDEGSVGSGGWL